MGKTLSCAPALTNTGGRPCVVIGRMPPGELAITRLNSAPFARPAVPRIASYLRIKLRLNIMFCLTIRPPMLQEPYRE